MSYIGCTKKKNAINEKLKEDKIIKELEGNVMENLKKENCLLKNEKKNLSNEINKLKSVNEELEIERKKSESFFKNGAFDLIWNRVWKRIIHKFKVNIISRKCNGFERYLQ